MSDVQPTGFPSLAALTAAHSELLKVRRATELDAPALAEIEAFIANARSTGRYLDEYEARWTAQSVLNYWVNQHDRATGDSVEASLEEFDPALTPDLGGAECPYVGLEAFREPQRHLFFGRDHLINELTERLAASRLVAVLGPSGSGKSSLVMAGLVPVLRGGGLPGSDEWLYLGPITPGSRPLESLAKLTLPRGSASQQWLQEQPSHFRRHPGHLAESIPAKGRPVILVIDQFEEVFSLCADEAERAAFVGNLLNAHEVAKYRLVLTMRSDFEVYLAKYPSLLALVQRSNVRVTPLSGDELRAAIEQPAALVGLRFENGVVDRLVEEILGEPAGLPLAQFALLRLWETRERNLVSLDAYRRLGGARRALAHTADEVFAAMLTEQQVAAKRILLRLVQPGEGLEVTSGRVRRETLYLSREPRERVDRVVDKLIAARLLRLTKGERPEDDQLEVAHEALVRNWPRLVQWLEEERVRLRQRRRLMVLVEEWLLHERNPASLLRGPLLAEAEAFADLNESEKEFLDTSKAVEEQSIREKEGARARELGQAQRLNKLYPEVCAGAARSSSGACRCERAGVASNARGQ